ncbi:MAG: hypothetical protein H7Y22_05065 [Gemmatimonadaceae bacterium]|nr:hypothetical protein [Gloeobacterales cyanobacterium ES-bin-141]
MINIFKTTACEPTRFAGPWSGWTHCLSGSLAIVIACGILSNPAQTTAQTLASGDVVSAVVDPGNPSVTVPWSFSGISIEYPDAFRFVGKTSGQINPALVQLLKNLSLGNGAAMLRIGGNSTDESWWNPDNLAKPLGVSFNIIPRDLTNIGRVAEQSNGQVIWGLNLGHNDPALAIELARAIGSNQYNPAVRTAFFEVGNEPDYYPGHVHYTDPVTGAVVYMRSADYSFSQYSNEYGTFAQSLQSTLGAAAVPLSGPAFTSYQYMQYLPTLLDENAGAINAVTYHRYPLNVCGKNPGDSDYPTVSQILADQYSYSIAEGVKGFAAEANSRGLPLRISEMNTVACGGADGVSNVFASALWGTDMLFELARVGVKGTHMHTISGGYYSPFKFALSTESGSEVYTPTVYPLYYGQLLFAQATANEAKLLPVSKTASGNVKIWATRDNKGVTRIVALNKDLGASGNARIQISGTYPAATLVQLSGSSAYARTGLTLAGQTFDGTMDGKPLGTYTSSSVAPSNGTYVFSLPKSSAAMLTIPPGTPAQVATRIDTGSPSTYADPSGNLWLADQYADAGTVRTKTITTTGSYPNQLFQTYRYGQTFTYRVPVPNGNYKVNLYFVEPYFGSASSPNDGRTGCTDRRVFDISVNAQATADNVDVCKLAGGADKQLRLSYTTNETSDSLSIKFDSSPAVGGKDQAIISAIELIKQD